MWPAVKNAFLFDQTYSDIDLCVINLCILIQQEDLTLPEKIFLLLFNFGNIPHLYALNSSEYV